MTAPAPARCPSCGGAVMARHPGGLLAVDHVPGCALRSAEDTRHAADVAIGSHSRPATPTEQELLAALYQPYEVPEDLQTVVERITAGIVRRSWPDVVFAHPPATTERTTP